MTNSKKVFIFFLGIKVRECSDGQLYWIHEFGLNTTKSGKWILIGDYISEAYDKEKFSSGKVSIFDAQAQEIIKDKIKDCANNLGINYDMPEIHLVSEERA